MNENTPFFRQDAVLGIFCFMVFLCSVKQWLCFLFLPILNVVCVRVCFFVCGRSVTSHSLQFAKNVLVSMIGTPHHELCFVILIARTDLAIEMPCNYC